MASLIEARGAPLFAALLLIVGMSGCPERKGAAARPGPIKKGAERPLPPPPPPPTGPEEPVNGGRPQEGLPTIELRIGSVDIEVEVADNPNRREVGLMYRMAMPLDRGMLFVYPERDYRRFWMKNTLLPLSLAFIRDDGVIAEVVDMTPAEPGEASPKTYPSEEPVRYCLEMNRGWFAERGLGAGTKVAGLRQAKASH